MSSLAVPVELPVDEHSEWLETDGLGGYASGTTLGINTRRYHGLLLVALEPPAGRHVLVNDAAVWLEWDGQRRALSSHRFSPDVSCWAESLPVRFRSEPWPRWETELEGAVLTREIVALHGLPLVLCSWRLSRPLPGATLCVRPLLSGRNFHALHRENAACNLGADAHGREWLFRPYSSLPAVRSLANAQFERSPEWYRSFEYARERERGLDHVEDLASPGVLRFDLTEPCANWILAADAAETRTFLVGRSAADVAAEVLQRESARRAVFVSPLDRAGASYLVRRGAGQTIIAGYPWFGDWGRDTFIALRGLCLATERYREAAQILLAWSGAVSDGMLPNRFADDPAEPAEYNSVDAALWYVLCVGELLEAYGASLATTERAALERAAQQIVQGYARGTRHGIRLEPDGLLAAGSPGLQLTWMDAKIGDHVVTPRSGKPVEIQALWLNALAVLGRLGGGTAQLLERGLVSFAARFDNGERGLFDVVDVNHQPGALDASLRPNQLLAIGGLPLSLLPTARCREIVDLLEAELWTPLGLRTLGRGEPGYTARYAGGVSERDSAYHRGTVWPWLSGPFIEAWVKSRGSTPAAQAEARTRFFEPMLGHLSRAGVGHASEVADAEPPHTPGGCPFQAWSVSELLRVERRVLAAGRGTAALASRPRATLTVMP
jgi:predicted glycogen debranching enzyme